jgi:hypothetical protein
MAELLDELDELIRTETVRTRHIQLVRLRGMVVHALAAPAPTAPANIPDNLSTLESDHSG